MVNVYEIDIEEEKVDRILERFLGRELITETRVLKATRKMMGEVKRHIGLIRRQEKTPANAQQLEKKKVAALEKMIKTLLMIKNALSLELDYVQAELRELGIEEEMEKEIMMKEKR